LVFRCSQSLTVGLSEEDDIMIAPLGDDRGW